MGTEATLIYRLTIHYLYTRLVLFIVENDFEGFEAILTFVNQPTYKPRNLSFDIFSQGMTFQIYAS